MEIPPDSSFKKEQLIIGRGRLQQAWWAFEQPASRQQARPLKAVDRGAGWRTGQGLESLGSAPSKVQPGALSSSPALSSHLVLSHNWLWQPSLLEISRKGECHSHSHNCHMALLSFSNLERNATTTNIKAIERGVALVLNCSKPT